MPCGLGLITEWGESFCGHRCLDTFLLNRRRHVERRNTLVLGLCILFGFLVILLMVRSVARADHITAHYSFQVGKMTEIAVRFLACFDENDAMSVVKAHEEKGYEEAKGLAFAVQLMGRCTQVTSQLLVEEVLWTKRLPFPDGTFPVSVARVKLEGSDWTFFSPFAKVEIRPADKGT
jgi:predicted nucleic acid-binding Zn ribbon protein